MDKTTTLPCGCVVKLYPNGKLNIEFDIRKINGNCPLVWDMLSKGLTKGVFQLESNVGRQWTKKLKPQSILHLAALSAILRPGSSKNFDENGVSVTQHYCFRKNGEEEVVYYHDSLASILNNSYGLLIYQEEAMRIAVVTAGFSEMEADNLRKAMGKKDAELMKKVEVMFIDKAKEKGILTEAEAIEIFRWVKQSQRYSFNKSHAVGYAILSYFSAYAKAHAPIEFFCSYLKNAKEKQKPKDEIKELVAEAKLLDVAVGKPNILDKKQTFYIKNGIIPFGICDIKGVGNSIYENIKDKINLNENDTWWDSVVKFIIKTSPSVAKKLITVGCFDFTKVPRSKMLFEIDIIFEFQDIIEQYSKSDLLSTLENYSEHLNNEVKTNLNKNGTEKKSLRKKLDEAEGYLKIVKNPPVDFFDIPAWIAYNESILLGTSISCSKVDGCDISNANATCKEFIDGRNDFMMFAVELERVKVITVKKSGKNMAFLTIKDNTCSVSDVCVFSDVYEDFKELLNEGNTVLIHGEKDKKKGSMIVKSVAQI